MRALLLAALLSACAKAVEVKMTERSWSGVFCPAAVPSARVISDAASWEELWKGSLGGPAPAADFSKDFAVAVFLGARETGGWSVEFTGPASGEESVVYWRARGPGDSFAIQAFTQPYAVRLFPKTGKPVSLREAR